MSHKTSTNLRAFICFIVLSVSIIILPLSAHIGFTFNSPILRSFVSSPSIKLPFETFSISKASSKHPHDAQFAKDLHAFLDNIITQYTTWHRRQRLLCEADIAHARSLPILVLRQTGKAGAGDRIRGILYTYLVAVASNRLFLIHWQEPLPLANVLPSSPAHNFTYDASLFTASSDEEHVIFGPDKYHNLDVYFSSKRVIVNQKPNYFSFKDFFSIYDRYPELNISRKIAEAGLSNFRVKREEVAPFILNALFETAPSLRNSLDELLPFRGHRYVSLHARLGHGVGEKGGRFDFKKRGVTLKDMSQCIGSLAATMAQRHGCERVFIVTDTKSARPFLEDGVHSVLPGAEVAHSAIDATHFFSLHKGGPFSDDSVRQKKFEEVFVDLGLLAMAESMIYFSSGYGTAATWLGAITDSVMVEFNNCTDMKEGRLTATDLLSQRLLSEIS